MLNASRANARAIFDAAVAAADPALALRKQLRSTPLPLPKPGGRTILIAIGKAAPALLTEALRHVEGDHVALAITHADNQMDVEGATVLHSAHPVPDERGLKAGRQVSALLNGAGEQDQVVALISGGGSALLPSPVSGLTLLDKIRVNEVLLSSGLDILQTNLVRQHLSQLKGGGFLTCAAPAPVTAFILSDVIGDDLRVVASGHTTSAIGSHADARRTCIEAGIWHLMPLSARTHFERSIPEQQQTMRATNYLIGSNRVSLKAAQTSAAHQYNAKIVSDTLTGDVEAAAAQVLDAAMSASREQPVALLFGGETTVQVTGSGLGGRNQELALRFAKLAKERDFPGDWVFLSGGTDGRDGPTSAAGAVVDAGTLDRICSAGGDAGEYLTNNDSHTGLTLSDDLLMTGATGTNVADIQILLLP
ncbi:MAG: glycerate kinase type-2 family protein [Paracoccaceae bacterium]